MSHPRRRDAGLRRINTVTGGVALLALVGTGAVGVIAHRDDEARRAALSAARAAERAAVPPVSTARTSAPSQPAASTRGASAPTATTSRAVASPRATHTARPAATARPTPLAAPPAPPAPVTQPPVVAPPSGQSSGS